MYGARIGIDSALGRTSATADLTDEVLRFVKVLKASAGQTGLQGSALAILWPLRHEGPMRLRDLAEHKGVDQSTVSRQVSHLVTEGLVRRDPDPADRRACQLVLTDRGQDMCRNMIDARRQAIGEALRDWPDDRVALFVAMFREFNEAVEAQQSATEQTSAVPGGSAASQENT